MQLSNDPKSQSVETTTFVGSEPLRLCVFA
jgi:hypothetical protein